MSKFLYVVYSIAGAVALLTGAIMIVESIDDESLYWLVFGIALMSGAWARLRDLETTPRR